jgi:hypothetical protein
MRYGSANDCAELAVRTFVDYSSEIRRDAAVLQARNRSIEQPEPRVATGDPYGGGRSGSDASGAAPSAARAVLGGD